MKTLFAALIFFLVSFQAQAMKITVVKNGKALIDLEGETPSVGEKYLAIDESGKRKGLVTIRQVKGARAIAVIEKGKVQAGYVMEVYQTRGKDSRRSSKEKTAGGLQFGYAMNNMNVKPSDGNSVSLTGNSFNLMGFYQMELDKNISVKFAGGYYTLKASGTTSSSTLCTSCSVDLGYLGGTALIRYSYMHTKSLEAWVGGGLGFFFAINKSSNILDTGKTSTTQTLIGSLGVDYSLGRDNFIPFQFEYAMVPNNSASSASQMVFSVGYGWNF